MPNATLLQSIKEARRDVLVSHYIANDVPEELTDKITDADSLYEYLLLDTKISELVKTSTIAEAISSVQLYIHRCIEGYEGDLTTKSKSHFAPGKFLYNWDTYNKRYATWAGKERLKYYACSYIDPSLRYNKTDLFRSLEQSISQGRLTEESTESALQKYLTEYEVLKNLEYISANKGDDENVLFFVGRTITMPYEYFWRRLTLKKNNENKLVPAIWSEWKKITANIGEAVDNYVVPYWTKNRLHLQWHSREKTQNTAEESINKQYLNDWIMDNSGVWSSFQKVLVEGYEYVGSSGSASYITITQDQVLFDNPSEFKTTITAVENGKSAIYFEKSYYNESDNLVLFERSSSTFIDVGYVYKTNEKLIHLSLNPRPIPNEDTFIIVKVKDVIEDPFQKSYGSIENNNFSPPSGSNIKGTINLSLGTDKDLPAFLEMSLEALFDYTIQSNTDGFYGPYGLYLWEIFFHIPFLIAGRFQTEQRYELAERWFKFIFNSAGYRDENGNLLTDEQGNVRYWNVVPLQKDTEWDETLSLATTDPDEIATANPMQYKLAVFIHTLEFLINRGDHAYRMLERDTLTEAKMYYIQVKQLLGQRPEIRINNSWPEPILLIEANAMTAEPTRGNSEVTPIMQLRAYLKAENGHFLPPYNDELLALWDKIELRLYNLRHNLSLDGQPLTLPLFTEPMDPRDLKIQYSTGDGLEGGAASSSSMESIYRFPIVIEKARTAVNSVIQFGNALENALAKQDTEAMTLLLQSQQQIVLQQTRDIQEKNLDSLQASLEATTIAKASAESTKVHYAGLVENWMSDNETRSLKLRSDAGIIHTSSEVAMTIAGALDMAPNVFGLATGGSRWGAASAAVAQGLQISANVMEQTANIMDISESYRRRREDWMLQRDAAEAEESQLNSQIKALQEQINMARKQIVMSETEQAHAQAIYQLQSTRFSSQALYNWMVGRLSSLYYQMYDATVSLCWMAKNALGKEIGKDKTTGIFTLPAWNDLYQGLLAGEVLMVELQKLENLWLEENKRGMEAVKTVSLDKLIRKENSNLTFIELVQEVLNGKTPETVNGVNVQLRDDIFSATLNLASLGLDKSYNQAEKTRQIKNLSVTLPALLGPYQDVEATLSLTSEGSTETVTLSHGMDDSGLFITDLNDSRFLPFEGMNLLKGQLTLAIFHTGKDGDQRSLLESLNDVILHIRYVMK
ncbi:MULTISPECIES: neuraminidase-like domain-containing protein [Bacillus cereus group]|uniref:Tc toxin subunit A-related protein n=1 Tax=Bacillus cereus group TaxID=86661 RepID=UPI000BF97C88|nr:MULTISPECIES: neuraminidase-like domain-containing protein [Bacillus cereus group]PEQ33214.1 toxin [Bacillus cereus]PEV68026.1 toxin [Bacillus thuringiensis]